MLLHALFLANNNPSNLNFFNPSFFLSQLHYDSALINSTFELTFVLFRLWFSNQKHDGPRERGRRQDGS
jgi:hypothetical protein